jgi:hypothetical protein
VPGDRAGSGLAAGDGKPFGARRDVAELAAKMGGDCRHMGRAEYDARAGRLGGAIAVNLVEPACKTGISYGPDVVFKVLVEPAAGQVFRALVVGFRLSTLSRILGSMNFLASPRVAAPTTSVTRDMSSSAGDFGR